MFPYHHPVKSPDFCLHINLNGEICSMDYFCLVNLDFSSCMTNLIIYIICNIEFSISETKIINTSFYWWLHDNQHLVWPYRKRTTAFLSGKFMTHETGLQARDSRVRQVVSQSMHMHFPGIILGWHMHYTIRSQAGADALSLKRFAESPLSMYVPRLTLEISAAKPLVWLESLRSGHLNSESQSH